MEGGNSFTRSVIDEVHNWDIKGINWKVKVMLLEVSWMKLILRISKEIKWKGKVV